MTATAWGLGMDFVGVLLLAMGSSLGLEVGQQGYMGIEDKIIESRPTRTWLRRCGWLLVLAGFAVQFAAEVLR